jgi:hypothetical protein
MKRFAVLVLLIVCLAVIPGVMAQAGSFYDNKYEPVVIDTGQSKITGTLSIGVSCHHNIFSSEIIIQRVVQVGKEQLTPGVPLTPENLKNLMPVGDNTSLYLQPDGTYSERFVPCDILVTLLDGNAGQPEYQLASIHPGETSYISFIGHAVTSPIRDVTVEGAIKPIIIHIFRLHIPVPNSLDAVEITIENPNSVPVNVDVTAAVTGDKVNLHHPFHELVTLTQFRTYLDVQPGFTTVSDNPGYRINFPNTLFWCPPTLDIQSRTYT